MVLGSQQDILVGGGVSVLVTSPDTESSVDMILGSQHVMLMFLWPAYTLRAEMT